MGETLNLIFNRLGDGDLFPKGCNIAFEFFLFKSLWFKRFDLAVRASDDFDALQNAFLVGLQMEDSVLDPFGLVEFGNDDASFGNRPFELLDVRGEFLSLFQIDLVFFVNRLGPRKLALGTGDVFADRCDAGFEKPRCFAQLFGGLAIFLDLQ